MRIIALCLMVTGCSPFLVSTQTETVIGVKVSHEDALYSVKKLFKWNASFEDAFQPVGIHNQEALFDALRK